MATATQPAPASAASILPSDAREGADILPDHVVRLSEGEDISEEDSTAQDFTDLDDSEPGEDEETG